MNEYLSYYVVVNATATLATSALPNAPRVPYRAPVVRGETARNRTAALLHRIADRVAPPVREPACN
jgi:hypothetical protein